jgi:hypothetical protein
VIISAVELFPSYGCGKSIDNGGGEGKVDAKTKNGNIESGEDNVKTSHDADANTDGYGKAGVDGSNNTDDEMIKRNMRISCAFRFVQGSLAVTATLILLITSPTVIDIVLNFTALNFISVGCFLLCVSFNFSV